MQHANLQQPTVPLGRIVLGPNPRTYFDDAEMEEMRASVRARGVDTPVLVRPLDDDTFQLIAGGRRYKAAMEVHGETYDMPVSIKYVDEIEAQEIALVENIQRADMSPGEEAVEAAKMVGRYKGDREEAARRIGWSLQTLNSRLALMNCSASVLEALNTRKIILGHAELLAAISKENQDKVLPVIVAEKRSVADVKKLVESVSCSLNAAIFDKGQCTSCPHNSSTQSALFGESIADGNCTNRTCYNEKTEKQLEATAVGVRDEFPLVRIVRAGDNHTRVQIAVDGPNGVGEDQAKACHSCQNYGAAVSALPDSIGKVFRGQCFDTVCNMKKVAARIQAAKAAKQPATPAKAGGTIDKGAAKASGSKSEPAAVTVVAESDKVKQYRVAVWRKALRRDIGTNGVLARQYLIAIVLAGYARQIKDDTFRLVFEKMTEEKVPSGDLAKAVDLVQATSDQQQADLVTGMLLSSIEGLDVSYLTQLCKQHKLDLAKHWKLDKTFLELLTKAEMMVVADEIGLRIAMGDDFKKVFSKSKSEVIEALLNVSGFDYAGKIPKVLKF
ncbi:MULTISPECIES: PRTRC system ParB family protein [Burkholderia cepacia complex]|uniref:Chromosome partitioning protein ParB n=1 Tax=Burkholderia aenigmatica TaxID=2015348 RepID=A0A228HPS3_9BURK|nr:MULTISPECIES: PRTRC system ParB family protein [Burkholderia cepacia complex]KVR79799.1 chromosome partitioning protein ParB [Burkholderia vietnamiensis]KVS19437.1 chromosome partitioning protein ParB [Burkholderia vietnamiensis]MBR8009207.1 PRTRC system ParB family protein [Burkholderia vietnamiensis]MBR8151494.1 PRTRC system ParB family protein [Burkholderia vietnamiensis]MBR8164626.1 PRTRC system ParB family protein [Burkholderia vietnamiensis]